MPAGSGIQTANASGGTVGRAEVGDTLTLTYNEQVDPNSLFAGWDGTSMNVAVVIVDGGNSANDTIQVWDVPRVNQIAFGTIDLGRKDYLVGHTYDAFGLHRHALDDGDERLDDHDHARNPGLHRRHRHRQRDDDLDAVRIGHRPRRQRREHVDGDRERRGRPRVLSGSRREFRPTERRHRRMACKDAGGDVQQRCASRRGRRTTPPGAARMGRNSRGEALKPGGWFRTGPPGGAGPEPRDPAARP